MDFDGMEEYDFDGKMDFDGMEEYDFDGKMDFGEMDQNDEENRLEPTRESEISQEPDRDINADNSDDQSSSLEQENESYENLNSESISTILISDNIEEEGEKLQNDDQDQEGIAEINQEELDREIEKELEEGIEAIDQYLEEEVEFINAYQEIIGEARELDRERESEGEERLKTEEEWEKEAETAAYTAEQLYESMNEIETNANKEEISEINEELEIEKEEEQSEEVLEPQLSDLQEEFEGEEREEVEQHQVEPLIEEALETEVEAMVDGEEIEELQEMDLEEQFQTVHDKEYIEELVETQLEKERLKEQEAEAQVDNSKENVSELEEELDEERDEVEQHQVEPFIEEAIETEPEPLVNDKKIEQLQELELEEQFQNVHLNEYVEELVEKQEEEKTLDLDKMEQENENIEQTQEIIPHSIYLQEKLEEREQELELEYEEKDEIEQHQVEAAIEEELETGSKPIINEEEVEFVKNFEPEKQLDAELLYELIEELVERQNEEKELEELADKQNEEQEEISFNKKISQIMRELEISQEINSGETEVEFNTQERELEQETTSQDEEVVEQKDIEERKDHQQEIEEILEQISKIEQKAFNEIESREEDSDKTTEKNYERAKRFYKQQTGKRPIYANKETKGFKQWLEQQIKPDEKEKTKRKKELKEEQKKEEAWKWSLKNWIEQTTEIDPELKSELKKLGEKYTELEKVIKKYSQLNNKAKREELSQAEENELKSLYKAIKKLGPIKIELLLTIQKIKHYLDGQYYYDFWDKQRVNQKFSHFFTHLSRKYSSLKQLQKKKNNTENVLKNWIEEVSPEEISSELKAKLMELFENYNELDAVAIRFMKLYAKAQSEIFSKSEQKELDSLIRTLQKIDSSEIVLFSKIRAIKHYLNNKNFDDLSNKTRVNRLLSRFFAHFEQVSYTPLDLINDLLQNVHDKSATYNTKDLIEDLRNEIQILSEELTQIFPKRLVTKWGNKYSHKFLSRLWGRNEEYVSWLVVKKAKSDSDFIIIEKALLRLQDKLEERLDAKALGCFQIIRIYQSKEINTLQFIDMLEKELGRVSGEIKVVDEELSLILAGTHKFISHILSRISLPTEPGYNPHYKFSKERLSEFRAFLFEIFGSRAKKCFDNLRRYELLNTDLKEYSQQQYTIKNPHYFQNIEEKKDASYWFGFMRADASRGGAPYNIFFELAEKDKNRLKDFSKAVGLPLDRIKFRTTYKWYKGVLKGYKSAYLQFVCRPMANDIDDLGFQSSKAEQKFVPYYVVRALKEAKKIAKQAKIDWWLTISGKVALAFLLGFYDGDGSYKGGRQAKIYASSKQFLEDIKELFEIKNKILEEKAPGETVWLFDEKYISKGFYSLALGPKLFDMMINSYEDSMQRKRPQNSGEPLNPRFRGRKR